MSWLLAVDPGLIHPAAALFRGDRLFEASRVPVEREWSKLPVGDRCRHVALAIWEHFGEKDYLDRQIDDIVIEWPQIYRAGKSKGDPGDLLPLIGVGMCLVGLAGVNNALSVQSPTPADWIGQLPKATKGDPLASPRGQRIWSRLSPDERGRVMVSHDALDAVGIGLWALGRLERRRVLPGAT